MGAKPLYRWIVNLSLGLVLLLGLLGNAQACFAESNHTLTQRLEQFPHWRSPPILPSAQGDLYYPDWMAGEWQVVSTLIDAQAPFAPEVVTPGFEASKNALRKPISFLVRFQAESRTQSLPSSALIATVPTIEPRRIVADRAYNTRNLTEAVLGKGRLQTVRIDPRSPNQQVAVFKDGQRLVTRIIARTTETPALDSFLSSEFYQQEFHGNGQLYLNQVENTIAYHLVAQKPTQIEADQVTAIYLSPQDPDYFKVRKSPTVLYRYHLVLSQMDGTEP